MKQRSYVAMKPASLRSDTSLRSAATPIIILVGLFLLFASATIDLLGNTTVYLYNALKPLLALAKSHLLAFLSFSREYLSTTLVSLGARLESYFYRVDTDSATLPSVIDAFICSTLVDLGRALGYVGGRLSKVPEYDWVGEVRKAFE